MTKVVLWFAWIAATPGAAWESGEIEFPSLKACERSVPVMRDIVRAARPREFVIACLPRDVV